MPNWDRMAARANRRAVSTFSEPVIRADGVVLSGVFDIPAEEGRLKSLQLDYSRPVVTLHDEDAEPLATNDVLVIRSKAYTVVKKLPDGTGLTVIHLAEEQSTDAEDWL